MKTAFLLGATGFIGSHLLEQLLADSRYGKVITVTRKPLSLSNQKLESLVGDLTTIEALKSRLVADDVFIAIGTTRANTPDQKEYYRIDHDYPILAARLAKENGAQLVSIVTAVGANPRSRAFYVRLKGEIERDIQLLNYSRSHIFEPSMLMGSRTEHRPLERAIQSVWGGLDAILAGPLRKYRGIDGRDVATAMIAAARDPAPGFRIFRWDEMRALI